MAKTTEINQGNVSTKVNQVRPGARVEKTFKSHNQFAEMEFSLFDGRIGILIDGMRENTMQAITLTEQQTKELIDAILEAHGK